MFFRFPNREESYKTQKTFPTATFIISQEPELDHIPTLTFHKKYLKLCKA